VASLATHLNNKIAQFPDYSQYPKQLYTGDNYCLPWLRQAYFPISFFTVNVYALLSLG